MNRYAYCIFADDVRRETNGKWILVGTYANEMYVPEFPYLLNQLFIIINVVSPIDKPFKTLKLRLLMNGKLFSELVVKEDFIAGAFREILEKNKNEKEKMDRIKLSIFSPFSKLMLENESVLTVATIIDNDEIIADRLRIKLASPEKQ